MRRIIAVTSILFALFNPLVFAGQDITRAMIIDSIASPSYGLLSPEDFIETKNEKGDIVYRAQNPGDKPILAAIIGPENSVKEITIIAGLSDQNAPFVMFLFADCAGTAVPEWEKATEWVVQNLAALAQNNGGKANINIGLKELALVVVPPNIVSLNIAFNH